MTFEKKHTIKLYDYIPKMGYPLFITSALKFNEHSDDLELYEIYLSDSKEKPEIYFQNLKFDLYSNKTTIDNYLIFGLEKIYSEANERLLDSGNELLANYSPLRELRSGNEVFDILQFSKHYDELKKFITTETKNPELKKLFDLYEKIPYTIEIKNPGLA